MAKHQTHHEPEESEASERMPKEPQHEIHVASMSEPEKSEPTAPDQRPAEEPAQHAGPDVDAIPPTPEQPAQVKTKRSLRDFLNTTKGKVTAAVVAVVAVLGVLLAIPATRYPIVGLVVKKDLTLTVLDSKTGKPVSGVQLTVNGQSDKTDANGHVTLKQVPVGSWDVKASKKYYQDLSSTTFVPILGSPATMQTTFNMIATGRQVPVVVTNKITGKPLGNVVITAADASSVTTDDGKAIVVLPADKPTVSATLKLNGYNDATANVTVTEQADAKNNFTLTPYGKVYFLSKRTGTINVMKSDLDGTNQSVVLAGTGKEDQTQTVLLASRDWKFLALRAKRDSDDAKLYLIDTSTDKLSTIDEGKNVNFTPVGWYNEYFMYKLDRNDVPERENKHSSIKSFNAKTGQMVTLDDTEGVSLNADAYAYQLYTGPYILDNQIIFGKQWLSYFAGGDPLGNKKAGVYTVRPDGSNRQTLKEFDPHTVTAIDSQFARPNDVYFRTYQYSNGDKYTYYEYEDGKFDTTSAVNNSNFFQNYLTYLVSPSGKATFWSESRDGKDVLFVGDKNGGNSKELPADGSFKAYGWLTDDYVLLSKNDSELYVMSSDPGIKQAPLKVTDYHKPNFGIPGYGYGYGGGL